MQKLENYQVKLDNPDFVALSQAYNIDAEEITSIDQLSQKLDEAIENKKAKLLHVIIEDVPIPMPRE
jgi:acetolactate synthase-1/2/3 large subunit